MNHLINSRVLTTYQNFENQLGHVYNSFGSSGQAVESRELNCEHALTLNDQKNYLFDLSYLGIINLNGDKASDFLQGQVTCDVRTVTETRMVQGAQCDLKGRILALMDIFKWKGLKMLLPLDLIASTINSLTKTALLSRVSLVENNDLKIFGFYLQNPEDIVPPGPYFSPEPLAQAITENSCCYHLGKGFYIVLVDTDVASNFSTLFADSNQLLGSASWHSLRLMHQQFDIYPESRGLFLPHRLGLHLTEYISFNKGCYKGQEIIARTHYKATLKHEFKLIEMTLENPVKSGELLMAADTGNEIGEVVDYAYLGEGKYLLGVIVGINTARI